MTFSLANITVIEAAALNFLSPILFMSRNIGGFVANVTIEEDHTDEIRITDHPVERGASITDHAIKEPESVVITAGWSNSNIWALGNPFYVQLIYNQMLGLQATLEPFSITTGKRIYENMLIRRISVKTDEKTENSLIATFDCREVIIANTQVVSGSGDATNMKDPVNNAGTTNRGVINPIDGGSAALKRIQITGGTFQ